MALSRYIGVQRGMLERLDGRVVRVDGKFAVDDGVWLLPHTRPDMAARGRRAHMCQRRDGRFFPDDFSHEQSLVLETKEGLVIFNSCSHGGVDAILDEVVAALPGKPLRAMVGGFHLFRTPKREVRLLAQRLSRMGAPELYTGHCTGDRAMGILSEALPGRVRRLKTGAIFTLED